MQESFSTRPMQIMTASSIARNTATIVNTDRMFQTVDLSYYDANGDGKLSREEFVDKPNRAFVLLDKDNTCQLSSAQVAGARAHTEQIFDTKKAAIRRPARKLPERREVLEWVSVVRRANAGRRLARPPCASWSTSATS